MRLFKSDPNGRYTVPDPGIVFKGQIVEAWLPSYAASMLPYDPRKLPAIRTLVFYKPSVVVLFEFSKHPVTIAKMWT